MIIEIHYSENNGGYDYSVYATEEELESGASMDGGVCTGTEADAIRMAMDSALNEAKRIRERDNLKAYEISSLFY